MARTRKPANAPETETVEEAAVEQKAPKTKAYDVHVRLVIEYTYSGEFETREAAAAWAMEQSPDAETPTWEVQKVPHVRLAK